MMLVTSDELQDEPNYQYQIVYPNWNEDNEVTPARKMRSRKDILSHRI